MKILQRLLFVLTVMALASGTAWSGGDNGNNGKGNRCQGNSCGSRDSGDSEGKPKWPELDAGSGAGSIALLTGMVLLMKERKRSKRSSDLDE
jgi:hypothetical protein